jgi:arylsulfatase A-like enzyme
VGDWADHEDAERKGLSAHFVQSGRVDPAQARRARAAYYALISHVDQQINRIFLTLQEEGIFDETMIVFASDHGEMLGDHNMWNKAMGYEGSARIPLIMRFPKSWEMPTQQVCSSVVELRDFLPTICEIAGVSVPEPVDGRSLLPLCRGEQVPWRDHLHGQHEFGPKSNHWVTDACEKYLWYPHTGDEQLFDLVEDPAEERNLIAVRPERAAHWREILSQDIAQTQAQ